MSDPLAGKVNMPRLRRKAEQHPKGPAATALPSGIPGTVYEIEPK